MNTIDTGKRRAPLTAGKLAMRLFRKVLFPVDMSEACTATAVFVAAMVKHFQAELTLLHVMDLGPVASGWDTYASPIDVESVRKTWREAFDRYLRDRFAGLTVRRMVMEGDPASYVRSRSQRAAARQDPSPPLF